jgi:hypothetical protein
MQLDILAWSFPVLSVTAWFIWLMIWVAIAFWPARVAARKGHSFFGFFLLSLLFFPLALLIAYLSHDLTIMQQPSPRHP